MNWTKLKEEYPLACEELKALHAKTGNDGEFLLDEYFRLKGKDIPLMRLPVLKEIENMLMDNLRSLNST